MPETNRVSGKATVRMAPDQLSYHHACPHLPHHRSSFGV